MVIIIIFTMQNTPSSEKIRSTKKICHRSSETSLRNRLRRARFLGDLTFFVNAEVEGFFKSVPVFEHEARVKYSLL